jgi:hypothetical protein
MVSKLDFKNLFQSLLTDMLTKKDKQAKKKENTEGEDELLIPQVRPAHKYPNSPWEMIHPPGGDNAVCM